MKLSRTTPIWMSLAVAISPVTHANEAPAPKDPQPAEQPAAKPAEQPATKPAEQPAEAKKAAEPTVSPEALAGLKKRVETMNKAVAEARDEAKDAASQRDAARKEAFAVREAKQQLETQLSELRKQLEGTNHEVVEWKKKATVLEKKLGAGEEAYEKLANFRDEMGSALKEFAVLKNDLAEVRGELQAPAERVALKKEIAGLKTHGEELSKKLDAEAKAHTESKRQLTASQVVIEQFKRTVEQLKNHAKSQLAELTKTLAERDALAKELGTTKEQLVVVRKESDQLKTAKAAVEKDLTGTRSELSETRKSLAMLQREASQLRATVEPLANEIKAAKHQAETATKAIREASAAREQAEQATARMENELKETRDKLAAARQAQSGLRKEVANKSSEVETLRTKIEEMKAQTAARDAAEVEEHAGL